MNRFDDALRDAGPGVTADDIMEFDLDGNPVDPRSRPVFLARLIHAEIYRARPDLQSAIHSHSPSGIPFGIAQTPLRAIYRIAALPAPVGSAHGSQALM